MKFQALLWLLVLVFLADQVQAQTDDAGTDADNGADNRRNGRLRGGLLNLSGSVVVGIITGGSAPRSRWQ